MSVARFIPKFPRVDPVMSSPCRCEQVLRALCGPSCVDMYISVGRDKSRVVNHEKHMRVIYR